MLVQKLWQVVPLQKWISIKLLVKWQEFDNLDAVSGRFWTHWNNFWFFKLIIQPLHFQEIIMKRRSWKNSSSKIFGPMVPLHILIITILWSYFRTSYMCSTYSRFFSILFQLDSHSVKTWSLKHALKKPLNIYCTYNLF